jgi:hypothetical protein
VAQERERQIQEAKKLLRREQELQRREAQAAIRLQLAEEIAFAREQEAIMQAKEAERVAAAERAKQARLAAAAEAEAEAKAATEEKKKAISASKPVARPSSSRHKRGEAPPVKAAPAAAAGVATTAAAPVDSAKDSSKVRPSASDALRNKVQAAASESPKVTKKIPAPAPVNAEQAEPAMVSPRAAAVKSPVVAADLTLSADLEDMNRLLNPLELKQLKQKLKQQAMEEERTQMATSLTAIAVEAAVKSVVDSIVAQHDVGAAAKLRKNSSARFDAVLLQMALDTESIMTPTMEDPSAELEAQSLAENTVSAASVLTAEILKEYLVDENPAPRRHSTAGPAAWAIPDVASAEPEPAPTTELTVGETLTTSASPVPPEPDVLPASTPEPSAPVPALEEPKDDLQYSAGMFVY